MKKAASSMSLDNTRGLSLKRKRNYIFPFLAESTILPAPALAESAILPAPFFAESIAEPAAPAAAPAAPAAAPAAPVAVESLVPVDDESPEPFLPPPFLQDASETTATRAATLNTFLILFSLGSIIPVFNTYQL